jgi:hypothetical protein
MQTFGKYCFRLGCYFLAIAVLFHLEYGARVKETVELFLLLAVACATSGAIICAIDMLDD